MEYPQWDKFNVDKELERLEEEERRSEMEVVERRRAAEREDKERKLIEAAQRAADALEWKDKGNEKLKRGDLDGALGNYNKSLALENNAIVLSNRALVYIKKGKALEVTCLLCAYLPWSDLGMFKEAESDCTAALEMERKYVKAAWRRATARKELGNIALAMDDMKWVLTLEPNNKAAKAELAVSISEKGP